MKQRHTLSEYEKNQLIDIIGALEGAQQSIWWAMLTIEMNMRKAEKSPIWPFIQKFFTPRVEALLLGMQIGFAACEGTKEAMLVAATGRPRNGPQN